MKLLFIAFLCVLTKGSAATFQWQNIINVVESGTVRFGISMHSVSTCIVKNLELNQSCTFIVNNISHNEASGFSYSIFKEEDSCSLPNIDSFVPTPYEQRCEIQIENIQKTGGSSKCLFLTKKTVER
jgi:hypothetical protein